MDSYEPFVSVGIALAAGLLIGLERERAEGPETERGSFLGGLRTYPLFSLLGVLSVLLGPALSWGVPLLAFFGILILVAISYADDVKKDRDRGLATEASILVTFLLGALAGSRGAVEPAGRRVVAVAALAVVVTFLLSSKPRLGAVVERISKDDFYATLKFLIVAVLVLPLLPNETMGPLDVINPFEVGLMVVLIAGLGFLGYVFSRLLGAGRGLIVTALLGGLVSSTAVTLSFAGRARKEVALAPLAAVAIVCASVIMFGRILVEVAFVHRPLLALLTIPVVAMAAAGAIAATVLYRRARPQDFVSPTVALSNPFELSLAVRFGLLFAGVLLATKAAQVYAGPSGMYAAAAVAGVTDVDAITLSTASLVKSGLDPRTASTTILIGAVSNTVAKATIAAFVGGWALARLVVAAYAAMVIAAIAAGAWLWTMA
ncbi:MAG TPA: MgtC/SapB family protein [Polyangiaceae bacterium]|nr:MgtC/SapB family protein [Polyangiaceae bacterium]